MAMWEPLMPGLQEMDVGKKEILESQSLTTKHRSRLFILIEILAILVTYGENGMLRTHIMQRINTNSSKIDDYLKSLKEQNLVEIIERNKKWTVFITEKGFRVYKALKRADKLLIKPTKIPL